MWPEWKQIWWMYLILIIEKECGAVLTISPNTVTIGRGSDSVPLIFECKPSSVANRTITQIQFIVLSMRIANILNNEVEVGLAGINFQSGVVEYAREAPTDFRDRTEIAGHLVVPENTTTEADILSGSYLRVTMNLTRVKCNDEAIYTCLVGYVHNHTMLYDVKDSANFTTRECGAVLTISPSTVTIGSGSTTGPLIFECKPYNLIGNLMIISMSIQRANGTQNYIVSINISGDKAEYLDDVSADFRERTEISGNIVPPGNNTSGQEMPRGSYLRVTMNQTRVKYKDGARYKCHVGYVDTQNIILKVEDSAIFITREDSGADDTTVTVHSTTAATEPTITVPVLSAVGGILVVIVTVILGVCIWNKRRHKAGLVESPDVVYVNQMITHESGNGQETNHAPIEPIPPARHASGADSYTYENSTEGPYQQLDDSTRANEGSYQQMDNITRAEGPYQHLDDNTRATEGPYQHLDDSTRANEGPYQQLDDTTRATEGLYQQLDDNTRATEGPYQQLNVTTRTENANTPVYMNS